MSGVVYLVQRHVDYQGSECMAVFATEAEARAFLRWCQDPEADSPSADEFTLDPWPLGEASLGKRMEEAWLRYRDRLKPTDQAIDLATHPK